MLKLVNVSKYYSSHNVIALGLRKVNLELHANEFVAIIGESGSGKTTLLNVICGIDTYEEGEMYLNGEETSYFSTAELEEYRKKYVAFVFQNYNLIDSYTVLQNVEAPLVLSGYPKNKIRARALEIIKRVGLEKHIHHKATKLSGGQKQRVVIARALAKDCPIIAADEPTGNLDSESAKQIIELLSEIAKDKLVIMVTHDFEQVKDHVSRKIRIYDGEVVEDVDIRQVEKTNLPTMDDKKSSLKWFQVLQIALRNLWAVPKKSIMMVLVSAIFIFFIALAYGAFNQALNEIQTSSNYFFNNTSVNRIVIKKADNSAFTQSDIDEIMELDNVQMMIPNDYVLDQSLYLSSFGSGHTDYWIDGFPMPIDIVSEDVELDFGSYPTADDEVILAVSSSQLSYYEEYLNQTFTPQSYYEQWASELEEGIKVVGIVSIDKLSVTSPYSYFNFIFMNNDLIGEIANAVYFNFTQSASLIVKYDGIEQNFGDQLKYMPIRIDNTIQDNYIVLPDYFTPYEATNLSLVRADILIEDIYVTNSLEDLHVTFYSPDTAYYEGISINQATYDALVSQDEYQFSILTESEIGVDSLVTKLKNINEGVLKKYTVVYPYRAQSPDAFSALFTLISVLGATITVLFTILASILISYIIFKAIINTKIHDYGIFRTIGANQSTIRRMIYHENYISAAIGFVIVMILVIILKQYVPMLAAVLKYYQWTSYIILFGISMFMAYAVSSRYVRKVFKGSVAQTLKVE